MPLFGCYKVTYSAYGPLFGEHVTRHLFHDICFRQLFPHTYLLTFVTTTLVSATDVSRQIFRDTCSRDRCFATDISRHLLKMWLKKLNFTLLGEGLSHFSFQVTSVAKYLSRNICRGNKCQEISVVGRKVGEQRSVCHLFVKKFRKAVFGRLTETRFGYSYKRLRLQISNLSQFIFSLIVAWLSESDKQQI